MKLTLVLMIMAGLAVPAFADDTNSDRPVVSHKQMMRDCMAKEKEANGSASTQDLRKVCREKIRSYDNHPSETAQPPANPGSSP
jgi:hypothetical protein